MHAFSKTTHHDEPSLEEEEEPIYVPRSIMADIIYQSEDDLVKRRHRSATLIELPSGAWQKRPISVGGTNTAEQVAATPVATAVPPAARMVLRQRRGKAEEGKAAHKPQPVKSEVRKRYLTG
jgi:hypothetical protein